LTINNRRETMPSLLLLLFNVSILLLVTVICQISSINDPILELTVYPRSGRVHTKDIELHCKISQSTSSITPLSTTKFDNVYISVTTDNVKPSGILVMFDDSTERCHLNKRKNLHLQVCNASLIIIRVNHTVLNDSLHTIDYACYKGDSNAYGSFRILKDQSARVYEPKDASLFNSSPSSFLTHTSLFFIILLFVTRVMIIDEVRWDYLTN